jgi:hypothetical protein
MDKNSELIKKVSRNGTDGTKNTPPHRLNPQKNMIPAHGTAFIFLQKDLINVLYPKSAGFSDLLSPSFAIPNTCQSHSVLSACSLWDYYFPVKEPLV